MFSLYQDLIFLNRLTNILGELMYIISKPKCRRIAYRCDKCQVVFDRLHIEEFGMNIITNFRQFNFEIMLVCIICLILAKFYGFCEYIIYSIVYLSKIMVVHHPAHLLGITCHNRLYIFTTGFRGKNKSFTVTQSAPMTYTTKTFIFAECL